MKAHRWFLPETPDVLGILSRELDLTRRASMHSSPGRGGTRGKAT
jgi:hypothetical protein